MSTSVLLDSHVWVWLLGAEEKLSAEARVQLHAAGKSHRLAVSEISFWELALKASKGVLDLKPDAGEWLERASQRPGIGVVSVSREILVRSAFLEWAHRDPADRILVSTALFHDLRLATADPDVIGFAETHPHLSVIDVRA